VTLEADPARFDADVSILERTSAIVPLLRDNAQTTDTGGRVAAESMDAMAEAGIFKITLPRRYGGYECSVATQVEVLCELARGCGASSWVAAVYSVCTWLAGLFADEAQDELFGETPDGRLAGVLTPTSSAREVNGGYRMSGRWAFNTGCLDARWAVLGAMCDRSATDSEHLLALIPYTELEIHDDWYVAGLRGTGSRSVSANDVFVPDHRVLSLREAIAGRSRTKTNTARPLFRAAVAPFVAANSAGTPLGLGRAALEAFMERLPGRGITFTTYADQSTAPVTHLQVGEAAIRLESAELHARRAAQLVDAKALAGDPYSVQERARVRMDLSWVTELARSAASILYEASGATAIHEGVPIQRIWRDIHALSLHATLNPKTSLEMYGRVLCGLEPQTTAL